MKMRKYIYGNEFFSDQHLSSWFPFIFPQGLDSVLPFKNNLLFFIH